MKERIQELGKEREGVAEAVNSTAFHPWHISSAHSHIINYVVNIFGLCSKHDS